jgi:hypothetical protein
MVVRSMAISSFGQGARPIGISAALADNSSSRAWTTPIVPSVSVSVSTERLRGKWTWRGASAAPAAAAPSASIARIERPVAARILMPAPS